MASTTQDKLYEVFLQAAGRNAQALEQVTGASNQVAASLRGVAQQAGGPPPTARMVTGSNTSGSSSGNSGGSTTDTVLNEVGKFQEGLIPFVISLIGLFRGSDAPPDLVKYAMPSKVYFEGADVGGGVSGSDYDQMGRPRPYTVPPPATAPASPPAGQQITVNVHAMDSRSFLDHSNDIARAVREAMLNLSPINDVVSNL